VCSATDDLTGVNGDCAGQTSGGDPNGLGTFTYTATAVDWAGNAAEVTVHYTVVNPDSIPPILTIDGVSDGPSYTLGAVPTPTCTAVDTGSGVNSAGCVGAVTGGNANGVGSFTYTATATDNAGNTATETVTYRVIYRFDGFLQPINDPLLSAGPRSVFKAGSTVPVKFQLKRADGTLVTPAVTPRWITPIQGANSTATPNEPVFTDAATSGTAFELTGDQWHYNWKTKGVAASYTYRIGVALDDGTTQTVVIALR
jgi:hypothetical protein